MSSLFLDPNCLLGQKEALIMLILRKKNKEKLKKKM